MMGKGLPRSSFDMKTENQFLPWDRILIRSGFKFKKCRQGFDMSPETEKNIIFLQRILKEVYEAPKLEGDILIPSSENFDPSGWLTAIERTHQGAEGGLSDELDIMDTYMAGIVRWINGIGISTYNSCDGHGIKRPSLSLYNQKDAAMINACIGLVSENSWGFGRHYFIPLHRPRYPTKSHHLRFNREWLLDIAENIYQHKDKLKNLVTKMRDFI